jgi:hypothetical protein
MQLQRADHQAGRLLIRFNRPYYPSTCHRAAFTVDALAPVAFSGPEPVNCSSTAPPFNGSTVPQPTRDDLFCYLPNFQATWGNNEAKWGDMWQRHGTCAGFDNQTAYFALAVAAAKKYDTDALFRSLNCTTGFDAALLKQQLKSAWGTDVWLTCNAANQQLLGIEVCLDPSSKTEPKAINCPASRAAALDSQPGVTECNGTATMRLGVEIPASSCATRFAPCASVPALPSACKVVTVLQQNMPVTDFEAQYCTDFSFIDWLNPWVGKGADFVRANATICLKNGSPIPQGLVKTSPEPSVPSWLPPWNSTAARQAKLEEQCPHHRVPTGYANATLCGSGQPSPLLAASMASGLARSPCAPCVYNPVPGPNATDVTAWRFDQDNACWMQVPSSTSCIAS